MPLNINSTRERLQAFEFGPLFIEELGWEPPASRKVENGKVKELAYARKPVARLSGIGVFEIAADGGVIPDAKTRAAIHKQISELCYENLLIFTDAARTQSLWYWVKRESGKAHARDHLYVKGQPGDLFLSKLAAMVVDISELDAEGNISVTEVAGRLKAALDVERVTKKFYGEFDTQRLAFVEHIQGISDDHQRRWYASVLMNRLMFIWFLQRKGFLDGADRDYLTNKLGASKKRGADKFYSVFLKSLFFEGFALPEPARSQDTRALLGKIRYLNGGLFLPHRVELNHGFPDQTRIKIPDIAFDNIFALFNRYSWNLNDTPGGNDQEINPDVLGYIFEKYINQKEFGAYYTRPEMTGYLCERTIFKLVLDRVNQSTLALTPALSPGERGNRSTSHGKSSASISSSAANASPSPPSEGGEGRGEVGAGVRQFHSISDLLLNLDANLCRVLLFEILPSLRLLDPACGSAAFLVAAMKVLIAIYSAVIGRIQFLNDVELARWHQQTQAEHPSVLYFIKKQIITNNLFGVDIMEEATEIARLRLFLALVASAQTEEQLEPLPNIDFNILAGNSLIGLLRVDAAKFDAGQTKSGGAQERMTLQHGSDLGFTVETKTAPTKSEKTSAFVAQQNAARFAAILEDKNKSIELYRIHAFQPGEKDGLTQEERLIALRSHIENVREQSYARLNQMLLDEFHALGIQFEQATWDDKKNDTGKPEKRRLKLSDIEALHPFHWGYEFDKVMADGGFDGIITNPPWEIFKPQAKEFFKERSDLVIQRKMDIKTFEKEQAKLLKDPVIREAWLSYLNEYPHVSGYFRSASQFKNQSSIVNGKRASGDINLYKLFLEQCMNLLRQTARCGIVVPTSVYSDLGAKQLREALFSDCCIDALFGLSNERFIFEGVDHRFKVCLLSFEKGQSTRTFEAAFRMHPHEAIHPDKLDDFFHDSHQHVRIAVDLIRKVSPDSLSIVEFKTEQDATIVEKTSRFPLLGLEALSPWHICFQSEFHMTNDSHLFQATKRPDLWPLFEGKMIHQFDHQFGEPRYWLNEKACRKAILGRDRDMDQQLDYQDYRLGFRKIARNTDERTMIATIIPPNFHAENFQSVKTYEGGNRLVSPEVIFYLCAVMNSLTLDYLLRLRVSANVNFFYVYQLPVPRLTLADEAFAPIVQRAAQLICTTPEFNALAKEVSAALKLPPAAVKGVRDPAARTRLRAELDAMVAHLYALTEEEFTHILTTFPLVSESVKQQTVNTYRDLLRLGKLPDTRP